MEEFKREEFIRISPEGVGMKVKPEEAPEILTPKDGYYELHLGKVAEKLVKLGVTGIKKLIEEIKKHNKEKFRKALEEAGVEVIRV